MWIFSCALAWPSPARAAGDAAPTQDDPDDFGFDEDTQEQAQETRYLQGLVRPKPGKPSDPMGPRGPGTPRLSLEQLLPMVAQNPRNAQAQAKIAQMHALLDTARFAWIPTIRAGVTLSPGANIACDDVSLLTSTPGEVQTFQYCRARSNPDLDLNRVRDYLSDLRNAGISLRVEGDVIVPITTFGKGLALKRMAKTGVALAGLNALKVAQENTLQTQSAYLTLQLAQSSLQILQEAWDVLEGHRRKIAQDPKSNPEDLTRLELGQIDVARKASLAYRIEAQARAALWALAGSAAPAYFDIEQTPFEPWPLKRGLAPRQHYYQQAMRSRPEALMAKAQVKLRRAQLDLARRQFWPDLGLVVGVRLGYANKADVPRALYYDNRGNFSAVRLGLGMRWEFVPSMRIFGLAKARAHSDEAYAQRALAQRWVTLEVDRAYTEFVSAQQEVQLTEMAITRVRRLIAAQEAKATLGELDLKELTRVLERWGKLEFERLQAIAQHNGALAKLSRAVGAPIEDQDPKQNKSSRAR